MRRTSACAPLATACALLAALLAGVSTQTRADITVLDSGRSIHGRLALGAGDRYQVVMAAGEFARVVVEQEGTDLLIDVHGLGEGTDEEFQDEIRPYGEERVDIVAREAGTYTLTVTPADGAAGAGAYALRLVSRRPVTSTDRVLQQSRTLRTAARRLERAGKFDEARPAFDRALTLADDLRRPDDTYAAMIAFDLAGNALELHDDSRARSLYERAIATFDRAWGAEHPYAGMARSRLALLCERAGRHQDAERLAREAVTVIERSLGPDHPWLARCLTTLANIRDDAGDLSEAEALDRRALAIVERIHETGTILDATVLNNLALVRRERGDSAEAEALFERSLAIGEKLRGPESYFVSTALQNLGIMARERKDYATALACYERALSVRERIVGSGHPDVAGLLNNLANVYRATGDVAKALETHFRALRIWERTAGPYGRATLLSVGNIARTYASAGDTAHALVFERRADAILERQLSLNLAAGSERQKVAFVRSVAERTDRTISLHLDEAPDDPDAASLAALVLLQRKGRVQEAMTDVFGAVRRRVADPVDRELMDRLNETNARLARLALNRPDGAGPEGGQPSLADLEARREQLEATLSEHSAEFRAEIRPVTLEAVQAAMPEDAALLEFTVYRPFDPRAERNADAYGPARYAAYVVRKHAPAVGRDLGPVATIDPLIERFRGALRDPATTDVAARARALDERVVRPLRAWLDGATRLLISPDGELNLVPFEALVDEDGRYLIERYPTSYVS
ncbi:MAG: tetratricopeptide repeat protein, partial [Betaproteobacteria bacterium]